MELKKQLENTILITGLPRSGTTLVCNLLTSLPNVIALHEPMNVIQLKNKSIEDKYKFINDYIHKSRNMIFFEKKIETKHINGKTPDNSLSNIYSENGLRKSITEFGFINIEKAISNDFLLIIKHNAAFTAILDILITKYNCFGIIRNPFAILQSWQTVDIPVHYGNLPIAEELDENLKYNLSKTNNIIERQLYIINWYFSRFDNFLPKNKIIKYEEIINSNGRCLNEISPNAINLFNNLVSKNKNPLYKNKYKYEIGKILLESEGVYWNYYSKEEIINIIENF